jgi:hypothetical protein
MEIEIFTVADFAQDYSGKLVISGTFDQINTRTLPAVHPLCSIAIRLRFANSESGEYQFALKVITPERKELVNAKGPINVKKSLTVDYSAVNLVLNLQNLKFETIGKYAVELYLDDDWKSGISIHVIKQ